MYVRWKKKKRKGNYYEGNFGATLSAVVVKTLRENGRVKQKYVRHIASIREERLKNPNHRMIFWNTANRKLKKLELSEKDLSSIMASLLKVVPIPKDIDFSLKRACEIRERINLNSRF